MVRLKSSQLPALLLASIGAAPKRQMAPRAPGPSRLEQEFSALLVAIGAPAWTTEYRWHASRKWRADFAWPERRILVEIEGGTWSGGRHTRGRGYADDCGKYNAAALDGWMVLRFVGAHLRDGSARETMLRVFAVASCTRPC